MNVHELIERLQKIEDKSKDVRLKVVDKDAWADGYESIIETVEELNGEVNLINW